MEPAKPKRPDPYAKEAAAIERLRKDIEAVDQKLADEDDEKRHDELSAHRARLHKIYSVNRAALERLREWRDVDG